MSLRYDLLIRLRPLALLLMACWTGLATSLAQKIPLDSIVQAHPEWGEWTQDPARFQVQVLVTPLHRDADGQARLGTTSRWGHPPGEYFYPASTVKMPVAALALEWLNEQNIQGLDAHTPYTTGAARPPQTAAPSDTTTADGLPTLAQYVRKVFLVSDNDAFNRMYELLGQDYINRRLHELGLMDTRILHRLAAPGYDTTANRYYNPVSFGDSSRTLYQRYERYAAWDDRLQLSGELRGHGYQKKGEIILEPFDFRARNYLSLASLHGILQRLIVPEAFPPAARFKLRESDYDLLHEPMHQLPRQSPSPRYDWPDNFVKFWLFGDRDEAFRIPEHIKVYNKVGFAYGYLTDIAFIRDERAGLEYFISGVIHVNENQIYNDGEYEYEEVGFPFFGRLGRAVHEYLGAE